MAGCGQQEDTGFTLKEAAWIAADADRAKHLSTLPASCDAVPADEAERIWQLRGKALFESPALLGGKAAQAGLSCASCHRNGRDNPDFVFQGISGVAGTADISHGLFSKSLDDDLANPVPIPDLAASSGLKFSDRSGSDFRVFLVRLVEEEFSGQPLAAPAMDDLVSYLASIRPENCPTESGTETITWERDWSLYQASISAAERYSGRDQSGAARLYLRAARLHLENLHERFTPARAAGVQPALVDLSREIGTIIRDADQNGFSGDTELFSRIRQMEETLEADLAKASRHSLYNEAVLRQLTDGEFN